MKAAWEIAKREVLDATLTWKLPVTLALTLVLVATGVLTLATSYEDSVHAFTLTQDAFEQDGLDASAESLAHRFLAAPNPLGVLVGGPGESVRAAFTSPVHVSNATVVPSGNPLGLRFQPMDIATAAVSVLTLVALLVTHDAIAGEKQQGTLKVLLVNPLSRAQVLAGKALGAFLVTFLPVIAAGVLAVLLLERRGVPLTRSDYARLALIVVALALLVAAFVCVGLAVSALTERSGVAVVATLFAWLVLVASAGSLAAWAAESSSTARAPADVLTESRGIDQHYDRLAADLARDIAALEQKRENQNGTLNAEDEARLSGLRRDLAGLPIERERAHDTLVDGALRSLERDLSRAEKWARYSPAEAFRSAAQTLAGTDYDSARQDMDDFSVYLRQVREMREDHARATANEENPEPFQPPPFRHAPESVSADWKRAQPFLLALAAEAVVAFGVAAIAFTRYDAR